MSAVWATPSEGFAAGLRADTDTDTLEYCLCSAYVPDTWSPPTVLVGLASASL